MLGESHKAPSVLQRGLETGCWLQSGNPGAEVAFLPTVPVLSALRRCRAQIQICGETIGITVNFSLPAAAPSPQHTPELWGEAEGPSRLKIALCY